MATLFDDIVITLDASRVVELTLRTGNAPSHADPRRQARAFASLPSLGTRSEAVRRCAAILIVCLLNKGRVLLLDSVDGGLPAHTARGLGRWLSDHQRELDAQLMIASAGSAFRSGLCSGGADVTLVRLRRHEGLIHVNAVPPDACRLLECSGIARAVGAGECLAANGILLTETDVERAIYQSLVDADVPGEHRIHVVHSLGPSTLLMMHTRLATVGVRVAVLATLDVFASSERFQEWCARLTGGAAPRAWMSTRDRLAIEMEGGPDRKTLAENTRELESFLAQLHANANETPPAMVAGTRRASDRWRELRVKGLSILSSELRPWVEELVEELKRYGLFLSPVGSVRQWFQDGRSPSGSPWIEDAMAKIERGACPEPLLASFRETITWIRMP
ncbi:MAG: hypothetical protein FJ297_15775 [Planctomycetes bacterium]|nr:hypothetical protein [Planctomycetota bacterium]